MLAYAAMLPHYYYTYCGAT